MRKIIETLKNADNESTACPYWLIIDPKQNMSCDPHAVAMNIEGPFFSREDAEEYLQRRRYNYSKKAVVYCASGYFSDKYRKLCKDNGIAT